MKKTLNPSWQLYNASVNLLREHYVSVIYLVLLPSLVNVLGNLLLGKVDFRHGWPDFSQTQYVGMAVILVSIIWQLINAGPLAYMSLRAVSSKKAETLSSYYRHGLRFSPRLILYYMAFGVLLFFGLVLFIIPAFFVVRRYLLGPDYLVDTNASVHTALTTSADRSKAVSGGIWGVVGVSFTIVLVVGALQVAFSSIGLLVGQLLVCTTVFLIALRYRDVEPKTPQL